MKPDLAEEAVREELYANEVTFIPEAHAPLLNLAKRVIGKLQAHHEAERDAAVREAVERAAKVAENWTYDPKAPSNRDRKLCAEETAAAIRALKPRSDMVCVPREPTPAIRQALFNFLMGDEPNTKDGWWGTSDQVEVVNNLYKAMLSAADEQKG